MTPSTSSERSGALPRPTGDAPDPTSTPMTGLSFRERGSIRDRRALLEQVRERLALGSGARLLDLGGGTGHVTQLLAGPSGDAVVLEPNPRRVARGRAARPRIEFVEGVAERIPFPDGRFDAVVSVRAFHHFADHRRALAEAHRVLRPGGRLVLNDFESDSITGRWFRFLARMTFQGRLHFPTAERLDGWLRSVGFVRTRREVVGRYYLVTAEK